MCKFVYNVKMKFIKEICPDMLKKFSFKQDIYWTPWEKSKSLIIKVLKLLKCHYYVTKPPRIIPFESTRVKFLLYICMK